MHPTFTTSFTLKFALPLLFLLVHARTGYSQAPLPDRIDQAIRGGHKDYAKVAASLAGDEEFLRRVYLDVTGILPTVAETRAYLADSAPDKRVKLVDHLLASPGYARHMASLFDVVLLDRRPDKHVKRGEWLEFLRKSFADNKPYDQFVSEILSADGADPKNRAPAAFYLNRDGEPHQLTRDISRLFLGMNLTCAQCHDHPLVEGYKQDFYYGVYAFLNRSYVFTDKATKLAVYAEKAEGDVSFQSVFVAKVTKNTGPRLPEGKEVQEPKFDKGKEYVSAVKAGERGVPKFSRRSQLAALVTSPEHTRFARATANRLWYFYLGRGIVHPVEYDHPDNLPSHPELLELLTRELIANKYDLKALSRAILLSQTYQRSSATTNKDVEAKWFAVAQLRPLSPEQFAWSLMQATGLTDIERKGKATEAGIFAKLAANVGPFVTLFGNNPGEPTINQDFEASLDQTLFLTNGGTLRDWLTPKGGNLADRLKQMKDAGDIAEEMYLSMLVRRPSADERKEVADYLARRTADRDVALQELLWALATSAEFRFNH